MSDEERIKEFEQKLLAAEYKIKTLIPSSLLSPMVNASREGGIAMLKAVLKQLYEIFPELQQ